MDFGGAFRARLAVEPSPALDAALAGARDKARAAWPALAVDDAAFAEHLAGLLAGDPDPTSALGQLEVADLYFALACAAGQPDALAVLNQRHLAQLRAPLARMGLDAAGIDETLQVMREELLAPRDGKPPRIAGYGGRGALQGWLRSVAARTGLRLIKQAPRHDELDDQLAAPASGDLELAYMKKTYGAAFHQAFRAALAGLAADDRLLLKQRLRHGLTVEQLGALHGVNPGTISRWVAAARERLVRATRAEMMRDLGVGRAEVSSILRLIESELDITLSSIGDAG